MLNPKITEVLFRTGRIESFGTGFERTFLECERSAVEGGVVSMFWDRVADVYDIFANFINAKTHRALCEQVAELIEPTDDIVECACGTEMLSCAIAVINKR